MTTESKSAIETPDPAAIFSCALSLWREANKREGQGEVKLSACYNGTDQCMREIMRIANLFEVWSCKYIDFTKLNDVWCYFLEDQFGEACLQKIAPTELATFDEDDCLRIALRLCLPVIANGKMPVPVDVSAINPVPNSPFKKFRIQTVRNAIDGDYCEAYRLGAEPFDPRFGQPYFALYGVFETGLVEFVAERQSYLEVLALARKLAPGINFPENP